MFQILQRFPHSTVYSISNRISVPLLPCKNNIKSNITYVVSQFIPGSISGSVTEKKIQCIFNAVGLSSTTRAATTDNFVFLITGSVSNGECDTLI